MTSEYDVLVVGGTLEGCVAALAEAEAGRRVVLVENGGSLGGLATGGLLSYFGPPAAGAPGGAAAMRARLLEGAGAAETGGAVLFDEQRLKVFLARSLLGAGVRLLTHTFLREPILEGPALQGFAVWGKTGIKPLVAAKVVDATERLDTTALLGCPRAARRRTVRLGAKINGVDPGALASGGGWRFDSAGRLAAEADFPLSWTISGRRVRTGRLLLLADRDRKQAIVHGPEAEAEGADPALLSELQAALRRACYYLLHELRLRAPGFAASHIVNVATRMDLYGLVDAAPGPHRDLVLCNAAASGGGNGDAVRRGLEAAAS